MNVKCSECGAQYRVPDDKLGVKFWCKSCRAVVDTGAAARAQGLPAPAAAPSKPPPAEEEAPLSEEERLRRQKVEERRMGLLRMRAHTRVLDKAAPPPEKSSMRSEERRVGKECATGV